MKALDLQMQAGMGGCGRLYSTQGEYNSCDERGWECPQVRCYHNDSMTGFIQQVLTRNVQVGSGLAVAPDPQSVQFVRISERSLGVVTRVQGRPQSIVRAAGQISSVHAIFVNVM